MSSERNFILSIDIGGANCKIGRVGPEGNVAGFESYPTARIREGGVDNFIDILNNHTDKYSIEGIALALPATVDWEHNHVRSQCAEVPWLEEAVNKRKMEDELHLPVRFVNDVEALLVGEWFWGELKGMNSGVVISLGESMGSALLWDGEPQQGRRGSIMELEHVSLETFGKEMEGLPPGSSSNWLSGQGLREHLNDKCVDCTLKELFEGDDEEIQEIQEEFEFRLAHLLGTVVMMLDPERLVLTGGLTASYDSWFSGVKEKMDNYVMEQFQGLPAVMLGQLRGEEVVKGPAAFWDWRQKQ